MNCSLPYRASALRKAGRDVPDLKGACLAVRSGAVAAGPVTLCSRENTSDV